MDDQDQAAAAVRRRVTVQRLVGFDAVLVEEPDGSRWLEPAGADGLPALQQGERIRVLEAVAGDATYVAPARVVEQVPEQRGVPPQRLRLDLADNRQREQQRRHVRVPTPPIDVDLDAGRGQQATGDLLNVSAGGMRMAAEQLPPVQVGQHLQCVFALPGGRRHGMAVDLPGEVTWVGPGPQGTTALGIRFVDIDEVTQARLAGWVLRQQASGTV